jgi:hypothetical protein
MKLDVAKLSSDKPVVTILTVLVVVVAVVVGGIVTITNPQSLSFHQYIQDIAFMAGALGLGAGIGRGIDSYGQAVAQKAPERPQEAVVEPITAGGNITPDIPIDEVPAPPYNA